MDLNELNDLKEKIEAEKERKEQKKLKKAQKREKKLKEKEFYRGLKKVYQADISPTAGISIYHSKFGDCYLEQRDNDDKSPLDLYKNDEKKITIEQAIELGGKDTELLIKLNHIEKNGTLLRNAPITDFSSGNFPDKWDYEVYECDNKYYYIERLYTPVDWCDEMSGWWSNPDVTPKLHEVTKEKLESDLGISVEELRTGREIWDNGEEIERSGYNLRDLRL